jgi:hypothetical protein
MTQESDLTKNWITLGIIAGLLVSFIYPSLMFIPMPSVLQVFLIMAFGPLLGLASVGLYYFITLDKKTLSSTVAVMSNIIAGVLITSMLLVQIAIRSSKPDSFDISTKWAWKSLNQVHLGLDVAWDVYICLGTFLFAITMFRNPKFGKMFSIIGIVISLLLIIFNAISFPTPPADSGLIDLGPFVGLWYFAATVIMIVNFKGIWAQQRSEVP